MHGSILIVAMPSPRAHPRGYAIFSFLEIYSPPPGTQKETIPQSTYSWNIQSYSQYRKNLDLLKQGPRGIGR